MGGNAIYSSQQNKKMPPSSPILQMPAFLESFVVFYCPSFCSGVLFSNFPCRYLTGQNEQLGKHCDNRM